MKYVFKAIIRILTLRLNAFDILWIAVQMSQSIVINFDDILQVYMNGI